MDFKNILHVLFKMYIYASVKCCELHFINSLALQKIVSFFSLW